VRPEDARRLPSRHRVHNAREAGDERVPVLPADELRRSDVRLVLAGTGERGHDQLVERVRQGQHGPGGEEERELTQAACEQVPDHRSEDAELLPADSAASRVDEHEGPEIAMLVMRDLVREYCITLLIGERLEETTHHDDLVAEQDAVRCRRVQDAARPLDDHELGAADARLMRHLLHTLLEQRVLVRLRAVLEVHEAAGDLLAGEAEDKRPHGVVEVLHEDLRLVVLRDESRAEEVSVHHADHVRLEVENEAEGDQTGVGHDLLPENVPPELGHPRHEHVRLSLSLESVSQRPTVDSSTRIMGVRQGMVSSCR
jgi:hypothetical protein